MKLQQQKQTTRFATHTANNNMNCLNNNNLPTTINNNVSSKSNGDQGLLLSKSAISSEEKDDYLLEFSGNKSDPKYQTLPYKFSPSSLQTSSASLTPNLASNVAKVQKTDLNNSNEDASKKGTAQALARGPHNSGNKILSIDHLSHNTAPLNKQVPTASSPASLTNLQPR